MTTAKLKILNLVSRKTFKGDFPALVLRMALWKMSLVLWKRFIIKGDVPPAIWKYCEGKLCLWYDNKWNEKHVAESVKLILGTFFFYLGTFSSNITVRKVSEEHDLFTDNRVYTSNLRGDEGWWKVVFLPNNNFTGIFSEFHVNATYSVLKTFGKPL